ncbi:MAG: DUF5054 domain-containing protein [Rubellimicrobium sp.]|nr:DUF5054 domain-containing protein [Rubellimicrobium sp.]
MRPLIHVIFKTHLDIGFTDHAARVRAQYHDRFIPQAIDTATHFWRENPADPAFIWTTGAWLIHDHLATQDKARVARLEEAIGRGLIRWHALPFTTHTELMSPALFRAGLSFSQELDARFGLVTRAAKMTDVPGHTLGMVPHLAAAGVRFLHLGVNTASPVPDLPDLFRWRAPDGSEVVVMYQDSYGATHLPEGMTEGLTFAHTNDNIGPQSVPQTAEAWRDLRRSLPGARLRASTLEAYGAVVWALRETLPVIETEIGDSWIHGSASDPARTARFLALQRLYDRFDDEGLTPSRLAFGRGLAMVAEHTCGVDIKSYLRDDENWDRPAFEALRHRDHRFLYSAASWDEQRAYMDEAVGCLEPADRARALSAWSAPASPGAAPSGDGSVRSLEIDGWRIDLDPDTGDLTRLVSPGGASPDLRIGYRHESYDATDLAAHLDSYLVHREEWAILDHDKPGLALHAATARSQVCRPRPLAIEDRRIWLGLDDAAHDGLGAPRAVTLDLAPLDDNRIELTVTLLDKPANRLPEAGFVTFAVNGSGPWDYLKTGLWIRADHTARRGGGQLQAVFAARMPGLRIEPLDTPLAAPLAWPFMRYNPDPPDLSGGLRFNLYNNKWGTNFPQWWEGSARARFLLTLTPRG